MVKAKKQMKEKEGYFLCQMKMIRNMLMENMSEMFIGGKFQRIRKDRESKHQMKQMKVNNNNPNI